MEWIEKFPSYWVLRRNGQDLASIGIRNKSYFAKCGEQEKHFDAYGILKFQKLEFLKAKKWCEGKAKNA